MRQALDMIGSGYFSPGAPELYRPLVDSPTRNGDHFLLLAEYADYIACQERVNALYRDAEAWTRAAVLNVARMGKFSSDRTVREYAEKVWNVKPSPANTGGGHQRRYFLLSPRTASTTTATFFR